jgi:polysaccharide biosynthesis/export protein
MKRKESSSLTSLIILLTLYSGFLASCSTSKKIKAADYLYFRNGADTVSIQQKETVIQTYDLLSIQVYSKSSNQEQAAIFNIPPVSAPGISQAGSTSGMAGSSVSYQPGYQVNASGNIDYPVFGQLKVAGFTIDQLQKTLIQKLSNYVKDPSVIVRFLDFNVNVLGEVHEPGTHRFYANRVTVIDALGAAGDLTDYAKREDIMVIREENGKKVFYKIDLKDKAIFESQVYILQPNDIVYVSPNKYKIKNLSLNPEEKQRKTGVVFGIISIVISLATLIYLIIKG